MTRVFDEHTRIDGTVTIDTTGLATSAKQDLLLTELQLKADLTETQPVSGPLTDSQLRATAFPVKISDGTDIADVITHEGLYGLVTITPGHTSTYNSTTATLAGGAVFTGQTEDITNFGVISVMVKASHASATNGLIIEFSGDGTNWDNDDVFTISANTGKVFSFQCASRYFRVRYINGSTQQTYFRLYTVLKPYYVKPSSHRIADNIVGQDDAELVKAVLTAEMPSGTFTPINATAGGNLKVSVEEVDSGAVIAVDQHVLVSSANSSTTNLAVGNSYTFTGTSASTLGVGSIQVFLFADKNCIVRIQQSQNGTNWDLSDVFYYSASTNFGETVTAVGSYMRVVVMTNSETTTIFRLQSILCPIANPLPRSTDLNGNLKISSPVDAYGFRSEYTPMGEYRTIEPVRLVGTNFEGTTIDSKFWIAAAAGTSASVAQANAQLTLTSGTSSGASVTVYSNRRSRYVSGSSMRYRAVIQLSTGITNNKRRFGIGFGSSLPTITDGAWFQLDGTEFSIVTCKGTTETKVTSFNGHLGATYNPATTVKTYEIYWTNSKVWFVVGDDILHTVSADSVTWANTMNFHVFMDSLNADIVTSSTLEVRVASIYRLGKYETQPTYYHISGNAATHVLKLGSGVLHKIMYNNTTGTDLTIVDNVTGTTPVIGVITTTTAALGEWHYSTPFNTGLILITTGNGLDATVVYE